MAPFTVRYPSCALLSSALWLAASATPAAAQVKHRLPAAAEVVAADAEIEKLGTGMRFVEGPVWLSREKRLVFSDIPNRKLMQWTEQDGVTEYRDSEQANGNTLDHEHRLISCQHAARNVVRIEKDGTITVLADTHDGKKLNSPNDAAVRMDGTIWFTDPTYGLRGGRPEQGGNFAFRRDLDGTITKVADGFDQPNGICFAPSHDRLYIADSGRNQRVGVYDVQQDGSLLHRYWMLGSSDGMRCDIKGNLYTTTTKGVRIFSPEGKRLGTIEFPEQPANCAFGGENFTTLFVTARTSLYRVQLLVPGAPVPPPRAKPAGGEK